MKKNTIFKYCVSLAMGLALSSNLCASYDVTTVAGIAGSFAHTDGVGAAARFKSPGMMSIDLSTGNLLVPDSDNNVLKVTTAGGVYTASTLFTASHSPAYAASVDGSTIVVTDGGTHVMQYTWNGSSWVSDSSLDGVYDPDGTLGGYGLAIDTSYNVYMADKGQNRIWKILPDGSYSVFASGFNSPTGLVIDSSNNLFVSNTGNNTICKITPAGVVTTIAGTAGTSGSTDAVGAAARFNSPWDIDIDAAGNLYIADRGNNLIRKLTNSSGTYTVSTIAGTAGSSGSVDGTGSAALFNAPTGLAVDAFGYVFVTDTGNDTIRRLAPPSISIEVDGSDSATVSGPIANDAHKTGAGTCVLSGDNSSLLNLSVDAGLVKVSATNHVGKSVSFNGGNMEVTSGTIAIPVVDTRSAATITTDASAAVSSIAAPYGTSLLTIAGSGVVTAGDMSASATPLSIPGVMHVGASSSSKMPTGVATVPSGGLVKIMGATASSVPGDTELQSGAVLEVANSVTVPAHTGADVFGTLKFDSGASLKLGASSTWARNISVGTAL
ncbi:MAG: hypothetical protein WCJ92_07635 [Alphaproteobacteria bacterium]